jgi:hypothetical protein
MGDLLKMALRIANELEAAQREGERELYEERAAIRQFLGGYSKDESEFLARMDISNMRAN